MGLGMVEAEEKRAAARRAGAQGAADADNVQPGRYAHNPLLASTMHPEAFTEGPRKKPNDVL
jgi:hypothetical protein